MEQKPGFFANLSRAMAREVRGVFSRPWEVIACLLMPLVWCALVAGLLNEGLMRELPVAAADFDNSAESREVIRAVDALPSVKLVPMAQPEAREALRAGTVKGILTIPQGWSAKRSRAEGTSIELYLSRTVYAVSTVIELDVKKAILSWSVGKTRDAASMLGGTDGAARITGVFEPREVLFGNQAFNFSYYLAGALIPMLLGLGCILSFCSSLVREWRQGRVKELLEEAGGSPAAAVFGKMIPWVAVYSLYIAAYVAWFAGFMGAAPAGSVFLWIAAGVVFMAGMTASALLYTALSPYWCVALVLCILTAAPTIPFTGFTFPVFDMDAGAQLFSKLLPLTWFIHGQEQQWVLASPLSVSLRTLGIASLFFFVPLAAGLPILSKRMKAWAGKEAPAEAAPAVLEPEEEDRPGFVRVFREALWKAIFNHNTFVILTGGVAFYLIFYGWPYSAEQVTEVPVAITDLDRTDASRALIRELDATSKIKPVAVFHDEAGAVKMMREDRVNAAVLIPANFGRDLASGKGTSVTAYGNGAFPSQGHAVYAALASVVQARASEAAARQMIAHGVPAATLARQSLAPPLLVTGDMFNRIGGYRVYMVPMVGVLIVQSVMLMGFTMAAGEWISSRRREPFARAAMGSARGFLGLFAAFFAITLFWIFYAEGFYFGFMELGGFADPAATLLLGALYAAAVTAFALAVAFLTGSNHQTTPLVILTSGPCVFLAGCIYPSSCFAPWALAASWLFPSTPGINGLLAASQNGASVASVMPWALHLAALALVYGLAAYGLARWRGARLDRGEAPPDD